HSASAWAAAWLTARGRDMQGPREVEVQESWNGEITWSDGKGTHHAGHRPDLAWVADGARVAIEVELARKSRARLEAILKLHSEWRADRTTSGVIYICADAAGCDRIRDAAAGSGLHADGGGGLRIELLDRIVDEARHAREPAPGG